MKELTGGDAAGRNNKYRTRKSILLRVISYLLSLSS